MGFTPQSAMDSVLNKHSVPESAMRDDQTKQAFAEKYAQGLQQLRDISTAYAKESSGGGAAGFGQGMAENTTHPRINKGLSSSQSINGGFTLGSIYKGTNQENINIQYREIRKVLDRHENTPEGRQSAASELLKMHDDNASHSSNRLMDLFHGGAWERKK